MPRAFDPERGQEAVATLGLKAGPLADLVAGAAGSSPFLCDSIAKEAAWVCGALAFPPEETFSQLLGDLHSLDDGALDSGLRIAKRRAAVLIALADLGGVWSLQEVTGALTQLAETATDLALKAALRPELKRGKLPGLTETDLESGAGLICLAMGKMGAGELNYSSDIDLILLYDSDRFGADDQSSARQSYVRAARRMTKSLSERTGNGYVFRTDLRLRPDASVTPVVLATEVAERYYESLGRTWERAAYIKARAVAGDISAGEQFLKTLQPFVWRRHLDFAAIQDAHDIRLRIRDSKGLHTTPSHLGHDLKLGAGGIREIEFFTQTRQLIAGGRDPGLRQRETQHALAALAEAGWVKPEDAQTLSDDYVQLREIEHRVQMIADQQTHKLPASEEEFARLAALSGVSPEELKAELLERFKRVDRLTDAFFTPGHSSTSRPQVDLPQSMQNIVDRWPNYAALRSPRAVEIFDRVRPALLKRLVASARPEEALIHIDAFLAGLPAGVQLFSLFEANPQLLDLIIDIAETAPALAQYLSRTPGVLDAVIGGDFFSDWPGRDQLSADLTQAMAAATDYEAALNAARRWRKEWHFRIGVHLLRGLIDADDAASQYADLAEAVVSAIFPEVQRSFAERHGPPPGRGAAVLAMGSLGARRLGPLSDLDMLVIYDPQEGEASEGARPLATRPYYARLTQSLVTALSAPMPEGRLYEVDMRLRPSGRQGPVATSLTSFKDYQANEAWTWEHLALTRARVIAGPESLAMDVCDVRAEVLAMPREIDMVLKDVQDMRARLSDAKGPDGPYDAKNGPGRMMDLELIASAGALLAQRCDSTLGHHITAAADTMAIDAGPLREAVQFYRRVIMGQALVHDVGSSNADAGTEQALARFVGVASPDALAKALEDFVERTKTIIDNAVGGTRENGDDTT